MKNLNFEEMFIADYDFTLPKIVSLLFVNIDVINVVFSIFDAVYRFMNQF